MEHCKMDLTIVSKSSFKKADDHVTFYKDKSPAERLQAACFIINAIFQNPTNAKVDRTIISSRKHAKHI